MDDTYFNDYGDIEWNAENINKEKVLVSAGGIDKAYEAFCIITTYADIEDVFDNLKEGKEERPCCWEAGAKKLFKELSAKVKQYTPVELSRLRDNEPKMYVDWVNNMIGFYCLRALLFEKDGKPIKKFRMPTTPIRFLPEGKLRNACADAYNKNQKKIDEMTDK